MGADCSQLVVWGLQFIDVAFDCKLPVCDGAAYVQFVHDASYACTVGQEDSQECTI